MKDINILVVEDEEAICEILKFNLENEGFHVDTVFSAEEALSVTLGKYDLFILDIMMSGMSGLKLADILKNKKKLKAPVIFLTAKNTENDTVTGFSVGADDYITKPFSIREVIARVKAILRRSSASDEKTMKNIKVNDLELDIATKKLFIKNKPVELTKKEFNILYALMQNPGRVFSRDEILGAVWEDEVYVLDRTVDVNITRLRKKLGKYGKYIISRSGYGYCFEYQ
jgi:two-component system alkaline phosphatase synthesis response regulator PhoP